LKRTLQKGKEMEIKQNSHRSYSINTEDKTFSTPFFFPSISSIKTNFGIEDYLNIIQKSGYPSFLISSYDINRSQNNIQISRNVSNAANNNLITLLDSGHYEAYWNQDSDWKYQNYESVLNNIHVDFCFSFDVFWKPEKTIKKHIDETITSIAISAGMLKSGETIPLLHLPTPELIDTIPQIVETCNPKIIGIPERELGANVFERAANVKKIRDHLDNTGQTVLLHLLGTGNPISILIYSMCGADLFDGLEWCQTVVNPKTGHLFHFVQKDLFDCDCGFCKANLPYSLQTLGHNLEFMRYFMETIQQSMIENNLQKLGERYLGKSNVKKLNDIGVIK